MSGQWVGVLVPSLPTREAVIANRSEQVFPQPVPVLDAPTEPVPVQEALGICQRGERERGQQEPLEGHPAGGGGAFPKVHQLQAQGFLAGGGNTTVCQRSSAQAVRAFRSGLAACWRLPRRAELRGSSIWTWATWLRRGSNCHCCISWCNRHAGSKQSELVEGHRSWPLRAEFECLVAESSGGRVVEQRDGSRRTR